MMYLAERECYLHVDAAQGLVDGAGLDVRHGLDAHLLGDGVDDVGVDEAAVCELFELGDELIALCSVFGTGLLLGGDLLPLCAVVEAGKRGVGQTCGREPQSRGRARQRKAKGSRGGDGRGKVSRQRCRASSECAEHVGRRVWWEDSTSFSEKYGVSEKGVIVAPVMAQEKRAMRGGMGGVDGVHEEAPLDETFSSTSRARQPGACLAALALAPDKIN